mmetsp:Transcript_38967/g.91523  ORF Transcript_38967/g.91523 Transcript_38967/m.91523 type:complete len:290 (-) Transcript_38967:424-1293(-)
MPHTKAADMEEVAPPMSHRAPPARPSGRPAPPPEPDLKSSTDVNVQTRALSQTMDGKADGKPGLTWRDDSTVAANGKGGVHVLESRAVKHLFTVIRNVVTPHELFRLHARRLMRLLAEEGIASLPTTAKTIYTACGTYQGETLPPPTSVCAVSIVRAGDALLSELLLAWPSVSVGKVFIQRDEATAKPKLFYEKLPPKIADKHVLLLDPMLATGGTAMMAIKCLVARGVIPSRIVFLNVVSCPQGIANVHKEFPDVKIVTCEIDEGLNAKSYIVPGLGDFGDRFFDTTE